MRTTITSIALLTLALSACSPDAISRPAETAEPNFAAIAQADTKTKHISGTLETTESGVFVPGTPPRSIRTLQGTGNASHLGRFTVAANIILNLATASGTGTGTYTAANGDVLTTTATGQAVIANGIATVTETVTVTGGTGRFAGATGTLTVVRRVVQATGTASGTIDGTIVLPK